MISPFFNIEEEATMLRTYVLSSTGLFINHFFKKNIKLGQDKYDKTQYNQSKNNLS